MKKLIVLEGPDGLGKSTQAKLLEDKYGGKLIVQPSGSNAVGFLRHEVKQVMRHNRFERQLLHTISHIVDIFTEFNHDTLIMDRCHMSTSVYSRLMGLMDVDIDLLYKIHKSVYGRILQEDVDIRIIVLTRSTSYKEEPDDNFERFIDWQKLNDLYCSEYETFKNHTEGLFFNTEKLHLLDVGQDSVSDVFDKIVKLVEE